MVSTTLAILALSASAVLAVPHGKHSRFHRLGTGTGTGGFARPTGGRNETLTVTVSPVPEETSTTTLTSTITQTTTVPAADINTNVAAVIDTAGDSTTTCLSTRTETATAVEYVTVTAGPGRDAAAAPESSVAAAVVETPVTSAVAAVVTSAAVETPAAETPAAASPGAFYDASSSAPATAPSSTAPATSYSGSGMTSKKGLAYNAASLLSLFSGANAGWAYNWAVAPDGTMPSGVEFMPMLWGEKSVAAWPDAIKKQIAAGAKTVLSFNEPDHNEQAAMPVSKAVQLHNQCMDPIVGQVKIVSPAVTNSNLAGEGLPYLQSFIDTCGGKCNLDYLAVHWYWEASSAENFETRFKSHIEKAVAMAKGSTSTGQIIISEFGNQGTDAQNAEFVKRAVEYLDGHPGVAGYAYFMVGTGANQLVSGSTLNSAGLAYAA